MVLDNKKNQQNSYFERRHKILELLFRKYGVDIHNMEDIIRSLLVYSNLKNGNTIPRIFKILLARILWGRIRNSKKNCVQGILDSSHSKAQMITLLTIAYYLRIKNINKLNNKSDVDVVDYDDDLYILLNYHIEKMDNFIEKTSDDMNNRFINNINSYYYCCEWIGSLKSIIEYNGTIYKKCHFDKIESYLNGFIQHKKNTRIENIFPYHIIDDLSTDKNMSIGDFIGITLRKLTVECFCIDMENKCSIFDSCSSVNDSFNSQMSDESSDGDLYNDKHIIHNNRYKFTSENSDIEE